MAPIDDNLVLLAVRPVASRVELTVDGESVLLEQDEARKVAKMLLAAVVIASKRR